MLPTFLEEIGWKEGDEVQVYRLVNGFPPQFVMHCSMYADVQKRKQPSRLKLLMAELAGSSAVLTGLLQKEFASGSATIAEGICIDGEWLRIEFEPITRVVIKGQIESIPCWQIRLGFSEYDGELAEHLALLEMLLPSVLKMLSDGLEGHAFIILPMEINWRI